MILQDIAVCVTSACVPVLIVWLLIVAHRLDLHKEQLDGLWRADRLHTQEIAKQAKTLCEHRDKQEGCMKVLLEQVKGLYEERDKLVAEAEAYEKTMEKYLMAQKGIKLTWPDPTALDLPPVLSRRSFSTNELIDDRPVAWLRKSADQSERIFVAFLQHTMGFPLDEGDCMQITVTNQSSRIWIAAARVKDQ